MDNKIALLLAGGGLAGAVYEIGALRAIDDLLVDRTVNDFDIGLPAYPGAGRAGADAGLHLLRPHRTWPWGEAKNDKQRQSDPGR
jgi:hypothetical protein